MFPRLLVVAEFVTINFINKINIMRNKNMIEPQDMQCLKTSVMPRFFKCRFFKGQNKYELTT